VCLSRSNSKLSVKQEKTMDGSPAPDVALVVV
jgi:hypothetical protein